MRKAIYPGSFDPVTYGHLDLIKRSSCLFDKLIVAILNNYEKKSLFSVEERVAMVKEVTSDIKNIEVKTFDGLQIDFAKKENAGFIIRGLRALTDFEYEFQMTQTNRIMSDKVDTIFLMTSLEYAYLSSSAVREVANFGGDISRFVPEKVEKLVKEKYKNLKEMDSQINK